MSYLEAIKDGFRLVNRNWQLVLIQLSVVFVSSIGFFVLIIIPIAIAFIIFGIDLTGLASMSDILRVLREPSDILSRYLGLVIILLVSFLLYLTMVALMQIYVFGGAIGVVGRSIRDSSSKFEINIFFGEAKRLFLRLLGFTSLISVISILAFFFLGILLGGIAALVSFAESQDTTLALFFRTFFTLILIVVTIVLILTILSFTLYGIASLFFRGVGPLDSIKAAVQYLLRNPEAFWLYTILFLGYLLTSFVLILLSRSLTLIPIIGAILSFPFQLLSYAFETYMGLMIIATVLTYYYSGEFPASPIEPAYEMAETPRPDPPGGEGREAENMTPAG